MTKNYFGTKLLATALATFALASCQSESSLLEPVAGNYREVELTGTISKCDLTRTDLALTNDQKSLFIKWNLGDKIHVTEENGSYVGYLSVTGFADEEHKLATFQGKVRMIDEDGTHNLSFTYLGNGETYKNYESKNGSSVNYDFSTQTFSDVAALAEKDLLLADCPVEVNGGEATFTNLTMKRQFAYGRFELLYQDEPMTFDGPATITISKSDMHTGAKFTFPKTWEPLNEGSITLTANNDFYVALVPGTEKSPLKFTVTVNGEVYEGFSNEYQITGNTFYRRANGLEEAEALPINVKRTDGSDDEHNFTLTYNANFGDNKTVNETQSAVGLSYTYTLKDYTSVFPDNPRDGYTFLGWTDNADGSGDVLVEDATLKATYPDGNVTVYAKWEVTKYDYTLVFEDGEGNQLDSQPITGIDPTPVKISEYSAKAAEGLNKDYTFLGWAIKTETKPTATSVIENVSFTEANRIITLVPVYKSYQWLFKWVDDPADNVGNGFYGSVRNGGYGPTRNLLTVFPCDNSTSKYYQSNKKDGYKFSHWEYNGKKVTDNNQIVADMSGEKDESGAFIVLIYAKWIKNPVTYSLRYIQNLNGSGIDAYELPEPTTADKYEIEDLPEPKDFLNNAMSTTILPGYTFLYWTTDKEGNGHKYYKGDTFTLTRENPTATLYGQWKKDASSGNITAPGAGGKDY